MEKRGLTPSRPAGGRRVVTQQKRRVRTLRDRLAHLNYLQACKLLGPDAKRLMRSSGKYLERVDMDRDVYLRGGLFRLTLLRAGPNRQTVRVTITLQSDHLRRLSCRR